MIKENREKTETEIPTDERKNTVTPPRAWISYIVPMVVFLILTSLESKWPQYYPAVYILKVLAVTGCLIGFRRPLRDIRFEWRVLLPAILVGIAVFAEWIWLDKWTHYPHFEAVLGKRIGYNPFTEINNAEMRGLFLIVRFYGLALMVPIMEELFWRSFLLRFITEPDDFLKVPIGKFSWAAFGLVAVAFGLAHPEWLEAILCAAAYGLLLKQTRSLFACVVAHGVTNMMLGIYVITTHSWHFW